MSDGSVMTVLCSSVGDFRIFDKNVICVKGGIVGDGLGRLEALLPKGHCCWDFLAW